MSRILSIAQPFPKFSVSAVISLEPGKEFATLSNENINGKWAVFFFWPLDFTFVCPTEIVEFNKSIKQFHDRDAELYGVSTDSQYVHLAWRKHNDDLRNLEIPMLADNKKELSEALGILHPIEKVPLRATFIIDPEGVIRWVAANDLSVGRNVKEVLRVLDALQTDELCPCNWEKGQATLK
ncbi:peroxiredoxin [Fluviispira multicolorata]|uniref:Alkyl hydroperoxide reductase C n=1 Tax=Fluviispira multicolorata TaxID=2654512 RepID=A0A833JDY0_9BACT|nr:peroxiredoxin [Fluviispira multicolorata]KAB8032135.1 redoxin domain-containing protein [Fluviispira multicolorata]